MATLSGPNRRMFAIDLADVLPDGSQGTPAPAFVFDAAPDMNLETLDQGEPGQSPIRQMLKEALGDASDTVSFTLRSAASPEVALWAAHLMDDGDVVSVMVTSTGHACFVIDIRRLQ